MPQRRKPDRVLGPYAFRQGWRLKVVRSGITTFSEVFPTKGKAETVKAEVEAELTHSSSRTYADLLMEYAQYKIADRGNSTKGAETDVARARRFFQDYLDRSVRQIRQAEALGMYKALREAVTQYGKPFSVAEQQNCLKAARRFGQWLVLQRYWRGNPLKDVELAGGRPNVGKKQLTRDQTRMWRDGAFALAADGDSQVVVTLVVLLMGGRRVSEVTKLRVNDLDDGGTSLRFVLAKTKQAIVLPIVDTDLQEALYLQAERARAWAREQVIPQINPLLFPPMRHGPGGLPIMGDVLSNFTVRRAVHRVCRAVGLPLVTTHALRGVFSSVATGEGETLAAVARALGNTPGVAKRHYINEGAIAEAEAQRGQRR